VLVAWERLEMQKFGTRLLAISIALLPLIVVGAEPPAVEDGKGLVVLYRMSKAKGAAVRFNMTSSSGLSGSRYERLMDV
jgi:hypothetical protein